MKLSVVNKEVLKVSNGWKASGAARIHFLREDGTQGIAEWELRIAYGQTYEQAEEGLTKRINSQIASFLNLFVEETEKS